MSRASPIQTNFTAGELTPKVAGRVDVSKYNNGAFELQNFLVMSQGGITKRPGTKYVAGVKTSAKDVRLIPFKFSITQNYIIEMGDLYFRFFMNHGQILSGGPYELAHIYPEAVIRDVKWAQSADVMYLTHRSYRPKKLTRTGHTAWTFTDLDFQDGPYLDVNTTTTTLTPSAVSGASINVTASSTTGINGGSGFLTTDVGRCVRIKNGATWGWGLIVSRTSATVVVVNVKSNFAATTANATWALGAWSDTTGWPTCVTFYEDRLWFGGTLSQPQTLFSSMSGAYEIFSPTDNTNAVLADSGLVYTISTDDVNDIRWMSAGKVLTVLTGAAEFTVSASNLNEAITPTNVKITRETNRGSHNARIVRVDSAVLFFQRSGRKLREYSYDFQHDQFQAIDLTILGEHVTKTGIKDMDWQQEPYSIIWCCLTDGRLVGLTYNREQDVVGWHPHPMGGTNTKVRSIAVIPSPDTTYDEVWCVVERTINGSTVKYVEYMTPEVEPASDSDKGDFFFVDCGLTGTVGSPTTSWSGATHLIGETIRVLADGAVVPDVVVDGSGNFTISKAASKIQAGLSYKARLKTIRYEVGGNEGTAQGKPGRIHELSVRFLNTLGGKLGTDETRLEDLLFRRSSAPMDASPPLFTGDKKIKFSGDYDTDRQIVYENDQPYPVTILSVMPSMVVYG